MSRSFEIAVFEGDGIGPEITIPTLRVLRQVSKNSSYELGFNTLPAGAGLYAQTGESLPATSLDGARRADAILLSAMGLPTIRKDEREVVQVRVQPCKTTQGGRAGAGSCYLRRQGECIQSLCLFS